MPSVPILQTASQEVRDELARRLVGSGYGEIIKHTEWLNKEKGIQIGKSAVGEFALDLRNKMESVKQRALARIEIHKALGGISDEDKAALLEVGEMASYDAYLNAWDNFDALTKPEQVKAIPSMIRAGAELSRSAVSVARWKQDAEARKKALEDAAARVESTVKKAGLSANTVEKIRRQILGIGNVTLNEQGDVIA